MVEAFFLSSILAMAFGIRFGAAALGAATQAATLLCSLDVLTRALTLAARKSDARGTFAEASGKDAIIDAASKAAD